MSTVVGIVMGSDSDIQVMQEAAKVLKQFGVGYEIGVYSAHRSPHRTHEYITKARERGLKVIIAGAGGAAHLAGVTAALTPLPVLGVPMESRGLGGLDSLLSIVQMPAGVPVATFAIGRAGAVNAALFAAQILASGDPAVAAVMRRGDAWGVETLWIGAGLRRPPAGAAKHVLWLDTEDPLEASEQFVRMYHLLWELAHVCFEHQGLLKPELCLDDVCITCSDEGRPAEVLSVEGDEALVDLDVGVRQADGETETTPGTATVSLPKK